MQTRLIWFTNGNDIYFCKSGVILVQFLTIKTGTYQINSNKVCRLIISLKQPRQIDHGNDTDMIKRYGSPEEKEHSSTILSSL
ncbi:unnamed protein product [Rotaria magnacalcarata]|uniref:Uncharacterized protein n=1 Tax=Rotaria magnacalcarata TaxID=392030 RepID=A0A815RUB0_9BILA|nr:unnamed protein product [Rotaria magnacalcarata]CAF1480926.1 unnamed protein product [Rotaria magnacalcarata]